MRLLIDTREQAPLTFLPLAGVTVRVEGLKVGDYGAEHEAKGLWTRDTAVFERKGLGDLFSSFTSGYTQEKAKWERAKELGLTYLLAIEGSITKVLEGHHYWKGGVRYEARKSGLAMVKQLCTLQRKYGIQVVWCTSRTEMAMYIQEYFLSQERITT